MNKSIVISNLRKNFKGKTALQDINLSINGGEIFGFLGPSGAGKTTTINILTGQLSPDEGTAKILGEDCTQLTSDKFLELGIMSDNVGFYDRLSLYDNLIFFAKFHNVEISYLFRSEYQNFTYFFYVKDNSSVEILRHDIEKRQWFVGGYSASPSVDDNMIKAERNTQEKELSTPPANQ